MLVCIRALRFGSTSCALRFTHLFISCGHRGRAARIERFSRPPRSYSQGHAHYLEVFSFAVFRHSVDVAGVGFVEYLPGVTLG